MADSIEIEYKYKADNVKLKQFNELFEALNPIKRMDCSSWDRYYVREGTDDFIRYRESAAPELTIKKRINKSNSWERIEIDLPLDASRIKKSTVDYWASLEGYKHNFNVYKTCFIMWFENVNVVYYITYDDNMKELDKFIEIEMNKDYVTKVGSEQAVKELQEFEDKLKPLGITYQNRLKRSLFDLYRK